MMVAALAAGGAADFHFREFEIERAPQGECGPSMTRFFSSTIKRLIDSARLLDVRHYRLEQLRWRRRHVF